MPGCFHCCQVIEKNFHSFIALLIYILHIQKCYVCAALTEGKEIKDACAISYCNVCAALIKRKGAKAIAMHVPH